MLMYLVEPMRLEDIPSVVEIERLCYPQPWPSNAYRRELQDNRMAYYVISREIPDNGSDSNGAAVPITAQIVTPSGPTARPDRLMGNGLLERLTRLLRPGTEVGPAAEGPRQGIVGFAGLWLQHDEAHITTIAVHPASRGRGLGELLLLALIERAVKMRAQWLTLEVRVSNTVAQSLYRKYTFKEMGIRRRYYSDNAEDALVMWTDPLDSENFESTLTNNRQRLAQRLPVDG